MLMLSVGGLALAVMLSFEPALRRPARGQEGKFQTGISRPG
jgi:hypothetical protein